MILYVGASLYHILCFSIHKLLCHPKEETILVIGDNIFSKSGMTELYKDIKVSNIFQRVEILKFIEGAYKNPVKLKEGATPEMIDRFIEHNTQWIEQWLAAQKLDLSKVLEFNSAIDHRHLGLYLLAQKIPYQYFEDGNGLLSRKEIQLDFHKKAQYASYAVTKRLYALGQSEYVTKRYANVSAQVPGFLDHKMEDFNVVKLFRKLNEQDQKRILHMFHVKPLKFSKEKKPVLYLTRYVRYLQEPTMENHHFISAMILDLFAEDSPVVIKPHPRDFSGRYRELFPDAVVLEKQFPSELLPIIHSGTYKKIITTGSTAIDAFADYTKEMIKLDVEFENKIEHIYRYIGVILAIKKLFPKIKPEEIGAVGCVREFLDPLCRCFLGFVVPKDFNRDKHYQILLADDIEEKLPHAKCICYLNTKQDYRFANFHPEVFCDMEYINISIEKISERSCGKRKEDALLFYTKDKECKEKIRFLYLKHTFKRTGVVMFLGNFSLERKKYMKILSEILCLGCQKERHRTVEEHITCRIPKAKKHVTKQDLQSVEKLLAAIKLQRKENYENNSICSHEA